MRKALFLVLALVVVACDRDKPPLEATHAPGATDAPAATQPGAPASPAGAPSGKAHTATIAPTQGHQVSGMLTFTPEDGGVRITGTLSGLNPNGEHGFHVHEYGDCSAPDASSAGEHFNPTGDPHGHPAKPPHHAGDMFNLRADEQGRAEVDMLLEGVTLGDGGPNDIVGKAVVVHARPDDYTSQPSGNSAERIGCGAIA